MLHAFILQIETRRHHHDLEPFLTMLFIFLQIHTICTLAVIAGDCLEEQASFLNILAGSLSRGAGFIASPAEALLQHNCQ